MHEIDDEVLDAIDVLVAEGQKTFCTEVHLEEQLLTEEVRLHTSFDTYANLPWFNYRRRSERTLWARRESDGRCVPELYLLAALKFGVLTSTPFWIDGEHLNTQTSNIALTGEVEQRSKVSKYGVKTGTPEYWRRYYADPVNRDRARKRSRAYAAQKRHEVEVARRALVPEEFAALSSQILMPDRRLGEDDDRNPGPAGDQSIAELMQDLLDGKIGPEQEP